MWLLLWACAAGGPGADKGDAESDSGASDRGQDCPSGSHLGETGACEADLSEWSLAGELESARDHHVSLVARSGAGSALYVMGGTNQTQRVNSQVERAWLDDSGGLGDFELIDLWQEATIGPALLQWDGGFLLAGGLDGSGDSTADTVFVQVNDNGGLEWSSGPSLNQHRYHASGTVVGEHVYVVGGMAQSSSGGGSQEITDVVEHAVITDGELGPFEVLGSLPEPTTHHAAFAWGGGLYVLGGGDSLEARRSILRADIGDDGTLGEWTQVGRLPEGRATSAAVVHLDQVYVVAGMSTLSGGEVGTVLRASLEEDGSVGDFDELAELPSARAHCHHVPREGAVLFSVGGSIDHRVQAEVFGAVLE